MANDLLFIYGSFSEGMVHFEKIANYILESFPAKVCGTVYHLESGFPVLISEGTDSVLGTVVRLRDGEILLKILDEFHGYNLVDPQTSLYFRNELEAQRVADGTKIKVQAYTLNPAKLPHGAKRVENGDWKRAMSERPSIINFLTERHKSYIKKLAESNRRENIVYPLDVCRDLERLQIIVDKGRRFALTNLGKEISRFI